MSSLFSRKYHLGLIAMFMAVSQVGALVLFPAAWAADNAIRVAGQIVFENKVASGGMTATQRAEAIQRNLDNALVATKDRSPAAVNIVYVKGVPVITLGGYQVVTVDASNAKAAGTTPALLAKRWADALRQALIDTDSINSYIAQLNGSYQSSAPASSTPFASTSSPGAPPTSGSYQSSFAREYYPPSSYNPRDPYNRDPYGSASPSYDQFNRTTSPYPMQRGRVVYAPAGLMIPINLKTSISTQVARSGDLVEAAITQPVFLGDAQIPAGSTVIGQITDASAGGFLGRSGMLGVKFNRLRTPDGMETPISAHIVGGIGKYTQVGSDESGVVKGETWKNKFGQAALRGAIGAGTGAALGTAIGAIAGSAGRGAWSGTAIGGGIGVVESLLLRKGRDVAIPSGTSMQIQLDAPVSISGGGPPPYSGAF